MNWSKNTRVGVRSAAAVAVVSAVIAVGVGAAFASPGASPDGDGAAPLIGRSAVLVPLRNATAGTTRIAADGIDGSVTFVGAAPGHPLSPPANDEPGSIARSFIDTYGAAFGVDQPRRDLVEERRTTSLTGVAVRYRQQYRGIPVLAGEISVSVQADGTIDSTAGEATTASGMATTPTVPADTARATAIALTARQDGVDAATLSATAPALWIYDPALLHAPGVPGARLVWRTAVRNALGDVNRFVLVDARSGAVALQFDQVEAAKTRQVCDNANNPALSETCTAPVLNEGGNVGAQIADVQDAYRFAGATYDFYQTVLGRDSVDGAGLPLLSTVRYCPSQTSCPFANAFWDGAQMVYGQDYASALDVVAHELTHGVTGYTSGLLYYGDAGAINESLSDVFGEIVQLFNLPAGAPDQTAWQLGEDLPIGAIRSMSDPPSFGDPDKMSSSLFSGQPRDHHGVHTNSGVNNKAAYLMAKGGSFNGQNIAGGIGGVKTAKVYYQAQTALLGEGSDYLDLSHVLPQACSSLVGAGGLTADDCTIVGQAVLATEMSQAPTTPGASLKLTKCPSDQTVSNLVYNAGFDSPDPNWVSSASTPDALWTSGKVQSASGGLIGPSPDVTSTGNMHMANGVTIPSSGTTYLEFNHAFQFDLASDGTGTPVQFYDGGLVGYSTTGAAGNYLDLGILPSGAAVNGYNHRIFANDTNPFAGRLAFTAESPGFQTTRINLTALAGQTVNLEFLIGTDSSIGLTGWLIDDVSIYQCASSTPPPPALFVGLVPARLLDSRPGGATVDGQFSGIGVRPGGSVTALTVAGRGGVPGDASAVVLNVAVTGAQGAGFVTVFPCGSAMPTASSLNYGPGQTVPNAVIAKVGVGGQVCLFTLAGTDLIVDVNGFFPAGSAYGALVPARLLDSRPGGATVDGQFSGIGVRPGGSVTALTVAGRGGVPGDASAVVLNVAVTGAQGAGFVTVFPCGSAMPTASSLNYGPGQTVPNAVIAKVGVGGQVCLFTLAGTDLIVDVNGFFPAGSAYGALVPARLLDSRPGGATVDGQFSGIGVRPGGSVTALTVAGRGGVPGDASAVVLNVAVTGAQSAGFVTVFPCGSAMPTASSLNYGPGQTVPNAVIAKVGVGGQVCLFTLAGTDLIVDVNGFYPAG